LKVLVTGGGGFLGRYIVRDLVLRGDEVTILGRSDNIEFKGQGVKVVKGDIRDINVVNNTVANVDVVFHVASKVGIFGPLKDYYETNVTGTRNILQACQRNGVSKLIYTSSPSVVFDGLGHKELDESASYPERYIASYPLTKAIAERELLAANGVDGLLTCSLRPHLIWGPGDTNLIPRLIEKADSGRLMIVGDGNNMIDTTYVENAAMAHLQACDALKAGSPVCGSAYFITQGKPTNCWDWINYILRRLGKPQATKKVPYKVAYFFGAVLEATYNVLGRSSEPPMTRFLAQQLSTSHYFSINKARKHFGYNPTIGLNEGLEKLFADIKGV
tara:strand:+ start:45120 stop:46112 length:993 start_codon:yes stop_codon:yes gene_type:complete